MKTKKSKVNHDLMDKNPNNWRGVFYYNPKDSRIFVPKFNRLMGFTLNFGNLFAYLVLAGIIILVLSFSLL